MSAPSSSLAFRGWNYVIISITFNSAVLPSFTDHNSLVCLDIGYKVTLLDGNWLAKKLFSQKISTMTVFLNVRDIGTSKRKSGDFALTTIYIPNIDKKGHKVYASISYELHLVDKLKVNILVDNNRLCTESFAINLSTSSTLIHSCSVKIDITLSY